MKRLLILTLMSTLLVALATTAHAADIKASGEYVFEFIWSDTDFSGSQDSSKFDVYQRLRTKLEFIANENLKGVLYTEQGTDQWGVDAEAGSDLNSENFTIKAGYIDFNWPDTQQNIKVGHFTTALPAAVGGGSMILDDESPAVMASGPITDNIGYMATWIRADKGTENNDTMDIAAASLPMIFNGVSITPFAAYGMIGDNYSSDDADFGDSGLLTPSASDTKLDSAWWAGASLELNLFDPFVLKADLNYGQLDAEDEEGEMAGWYAATSLAYTGLDFMTPEVFFAYTSGEDVDDDDLASERMPILSNDWALGSFFFGGDWALEGSIDGDAASMGFWTAGVSLTDISFVQGMKHTINLLYIKGTNSEDLLDTACDNNVEFGKTLLEDDSLVEVDLNTQYSIFDELTAYVELGWISADWSDKWESVESDMDDYAYKASMGLEYAF